MMSWNYLLFREHSSAYQAPFTSTISMVKQLPSALNERVIMMDNTDKVFASEWLSEQYIVFGTKCCKLLVLDVNSGNLFSIPLLRNSQTLKNPSSCGIHDISTDPSYRYVATCGHNPNELAVYKYPTFDPLLIGRGHRDWIFSLAWVQDSVVVTGSRDSTMGVWKVPEEANDKVHMAEEVPSLKPCHSFCNKTTSGANDKVRDLVFDKSRQVLASLQSTHCDACIHFWDINTFQETAVTSLRHGAENVCISLDEQLGLLAVGSRSHVTLLDPRMDGRAKSPISLYSPDAGNGVRSVELKQGILSFGTGDGNVYFHDVRFTTTHLPHLKEAITRLRTSKGYLRHDDIYRDFFHHLEDLRHAIYTHKYNPCGTKLFVAGGPLPLGLYGSYAAIWQ